MTEDKAGMAPDDKLPNDGAGSDAAAEGAEVEVTEEEPEEMRRDDEEARQDWVRLERAAEAAADEAASSAREVLEVCLAPALAREVLRSQARVAARAMLAVLLEPALSKEEKDKEEARARAQAEAEAAAAAAKVEAEAEARRRRVDPPLECYPRGRPPDCVPTRELGELGASPKRPSEGERVAHQIALRANRSLSWGAPRQAPPDEVVYGPAVASPVESLIAAEQAWLKSCHAQMDSGLADRLVSNRADFAPRLPEIPLRHGALPAGCAVGSARPFLATPLGSNAVNAQAQKIRAKEAEVQRLEKRQAVLQSVLPFVEQQIHAVQVLKNTLSCDFYVVHVLGH
jgi:hypothetical protein